MIVLKIKHNISMRLSPCIGREKTAFEQKPRTRLHFEVTIEVPKTLLLTKEHAKTNIVDKMNQSGISGIDQSQNAP